MVTTTKPITIDDYWRMLECGKISSDRIELIGGELMEMSPQSTWHTSTIHRLQTLLQRVFRRKYYWVRARDTVDLGPYSHPDPDIAVVIGSMRHWEVLNTIPDHAVLVVEVSESTLQSDRTHKASLYAASNILDYWIVNLVDRQLEVCREPIADANEPFSFRYATLTTLQPQEFATPLAMPSEQITVADLLPR